MSDEQELLAALRETNALLTKMLEAQERSRVRAEELLEVNRNRPDPGETFKKSLDEFKAKMPSLQGSMDKYEGQISQRQATEQAIGGALTEQTELLRNIAARLGESG